MLAFERVDAPGSWQLPQGGLNAGEEPIEGAWRELMEETGLGDDARRSLRAEYPEWVVYEWPVELQREHGGSDGRDRARCSGGSCSTPLAPTSSPTPTAASSSPGSGSSRDWLIDHVPEWRRDAYARCWHALSALSVSGSVGRVTDLFSAAAEDRLRRQAPLAARLRPRTLDDVVGQDAPGRARASRCAAWSSRTG